MSMRGAFLGWSEKYGGHGNEESAFEAGWHAAQQLAEPPVTSTNTGSPKLPGVKKYLVWADKRQIRKTGHRLTQSDLDLLEAGYKFIARQLRAGA